MHSIILSSDNLVIGHSTNLQYLENGTVATSQYTRYAKSSYKTIFEVESIPEDYVDGKYKYTTEDGFIVSEHWVDPEKPINILDLKSEIQTLKEENAQMLYALMMGGLV